MSGKRKQTGHGGWWFLVLVLCGYGLYGLLDPGLTTKAVALFAAIFYQVLPILGLVFVLLFIANLLLKPNRIRRYLGRESGIKGWIAALVGGVLSVGSVYAWYPVLGELQEKGMRRALIAAFLYSRAVKLPLLPLMIHYFGVTYSLVLSCYLIVFSIINGLLVERLTGHRSG